MLKVDLYSSKGVKKEKISIPKEIETEGNLNLVAQAVHVYEERAHIGLSKAKTRSEVNKTKKKAYRQKGTGSARHGARSAPIFVGGGVAHGPKPVKRNLSLPKKMRKKALFEAITLKVKEDKAFAVEGLSSIGKTKQVAGLLEKLGVLNKRTIFVVSEKNSLPRLVRNIKNSKVVSYKDTNAYEIFLAEFILFDSELFKGTRRKKK
ncbi:50S ribosomal protein L4 [Candidatus Woesebacteria bacterium]|nr:50S ribosomal protein L4 [Candidatus Woesebacteria bacterium]